MTPNAVKKSALDWLEHGDAVAASREVEAGLAEWPDSAPLQLTKGLVLLESQGAGEAARYFLSMLDGRPAQVWAMARLKQIVAKRELSPGDAIEVGTAIAQSQLSEAEKLQLLELLYKPLERPDAIAFLRAVAPGSGLFRFEWRLAVAETEAGNLDAAIALLEPAQTQGRATEAATMLLAELLIVRSRLPEAVLLMADTAAKAPDRAEVQRRLIHVLQRAGLYDRAADVMHLALQRWPSDWMLLFRLNRMPVSPPKLRDLFETIQPKADALAQKDERYRFQLALACLHMREFGRAAELLAEPFTAPVNAMADAVRDVLASRPNWFWKLGPRFSDDRTLDVRVATTPGARMTIIVPTGVFFGYQPITMLDALLAKHRMNVIYLRDFNQRGYLKGVKSLGKGIDATIAALKQMIADLGAPRTVVMGSSLGGFSAMRYGALLGAHAAVSFSGPTDILSAYDSTREAVWNPAYFAKLQLKQETDLACDNKPFIEAARDTRFIQYYGANSNDDVTQSRRLAGLRNVELIPLPGISDHVVVNNLIASGEFDAMIEGLAG